MDEACGACKMGRIGKDRGLLLFSLSLFALLEVGLRSFLHTFLQYHELLTFHYPQGGLIGATERTCPDCKYASKIRRRRC